MLKKQKQKVYCKIKKIRDCIMEDAISSIEKKVNFEYEYISQDLGFESL
jgi:hypothetical protein